jgi:hypothetical protein
MKTLVRLLALVALCLLSTGCVFRSYQEGSAKYTSFSFATGQGVAPFSIEAGKKDDPSYRKMDSKGLTNDPSAAAIEAAVTAAIKAVK